MALEHKPHFPASEFHITVYEGDDVEFADRLLGTLQRFGWMFRVQLPDHTTLTHVQLKRSGTRGVKVRPKLSPTLQALFRKLTKERLTWRALDALTNAERLRIACKICENLHGVTAGLTRVPRTRKEGPVERDGEAQEWKGDVHLTPPELATAIARYAVSLMDPGDPAVHFGDPAVGNGAFYAALLQVVARERIASAVGVDIGWEQVEMARSRWGHRGLDVMRADYLHMERLQPRTLILANPPYLRHQGIPAAYKTRLRERASVIMGTRIDGKAGQYVYFLILSHKWLADGGVGAWLIPSGFMRSRYGRDVRRYLTEEVSLVRIHEFGAEDPQFENAKVLTAVVVFRKGKPNLDRTAMLSIGGSLEAPERSRFVSVGALKSQDRWAVWCREANGGGSRVCIGDLFSVRRGIATGANEFFVLSRDAARARGLPDRALRPILPKSRRLKSDVVERAEDGWPEVDPQLCVVDCELSEEEITARYPELSKYLASARGLGILERNLVRHRNPWYRQERRLPTMFLCTYMGRGSAEHLPLRFIWNKSDAIATNAYLMMYPNQKLARVLGEAPTASREVFATLRRAAAGTIGEYWRTYLGGLRKIEPGELLEVGLPGAPEWLVGLGRERHGGGELWQSVGG